MKLKKVTINDPMERLAVSVRKSTMDLVGAYQSHYEAVYGEKIERSQLVEEILREFISADKDFVKKQSAPASKTKPAAAASADTGSAGQA